MGIDEIITLEDNKEYVLMLKSVLNNEKYFLASLMKDGQPSEEFVIFKEISEDGEISVEEVNDQNILASLEELFTAQIEQE